MYTLPLSFGISVFDVRCVCSMLIHTHTHIQETTRNTRISMSVATTNFKIIFKKLVLLGQIQREYLEILVLQYSSS